MAAGLTQVTGRDNANNTVKFNQWSSDGTIAGNLSPAIHAQDGEIETIGAKADAAYADATGAAAGSVVAVLKGIFGKLMSGIGITGTVSVSNLPATQPVSGNVGLNGTLPAFAATPTVNIGTAPSIAVTGPATDAQMRASALPVSGPLTDTQMRASAVPVSAASLGAVADAAYSDATGAANGSLPSLLKGLFVALKALLKVDTVVQTTANTPAANTVTAGGTAQTLFAANAARRGIAVQNQSTGDLYIATAATLTQASLKIPAGGYYETPSTHVGTAIIQIIGATTGQAFWAREW